MKRTFCEQCREEVEYSVEEVSMTGKLRGIAYPFIGKEARCASCNELVYVPEINDSNLKALYDAYREKNGIVSLEEIQEIPKKYAIGKRPLSLLLGWGEQTFSRYYDGDMPTKQYSDVLMKVCESPAYYSEILEAGKGHLKSQATYEKSRRALDQLLGQSDLETSKINAAAAYLLSRCGDITPLALQKALYYIQGFYFAFYHSFLFEEDCQAWPHGPVYREIYDRYHEYRLDSNIGNVSFDDSVLTLSEKAVFESVADNLCCYSGKILEEFTHREAPWLETSANEIISKDAIAAYFAGVKSKYNMKEPGDIQAYASDLFENIENI